MAYSIARAQEKYEVAETLINAALVKAMEVSVELKPTLYPTI